MKFLNYRFILPLFFSFSLSAQDVAFCGMDGVGGDEFSFVALRDFSAGELIYFTEEDYSDSANAFGTGEGHLVYTVAVGGLAENTVIVITETGTDVFTVSGGSGVATAVAGTGSWSIVTGDEIYAYYASNPASPWNSITEIHCFIWTNVTVPSLDQQVSSDYPNSITIDFNIGGTGSITTNFNDPSRVNTTLADLLNGANWTSSTTDRTLSPTNFTSQMIALPVVWLAFTAKAEGTGVMLKWQTAKEENNDYFQIERSVDGRNFSTLEKIEGNGTTNNFSNYTFLDEKPAAGINYYRLKQVDYDGAFEYSDIAIAQFGDGSATVGVYPNPFSDQLTLSLPPGSDINDRASNPVLKITNLHGQVIRQEAIVSSPNYSLNLGDLTSGTYILQVYQDGLVSATQRLVKL